MTKEEITMETNRNKARQWTSTDCIKNYIKCEWIKPSSVVRKDKIATFKCNLQEIILNI